MFFVRLFRDNLIISRYLYILNFFTVNFDFLVKNHDFALNTISSNEEVTFVLVLFVKMNVVSSTNQLIYKVSLIGLDR